MTRVEITEDLIRNGMSRHGGWSYHQLAILGVNLPPQQGWKLKVIGKTIPDHAAEEFLQLKNKHLERKLQKPSGKKRSKHPGFQEPNKDKGGGMFFLMDGRAKDVNNADSATVLATARSKDEAVLIGLSVTFRDAIWYKDGQPRWDIPPAK